MPLLLKITLSFERNFAYLFPNLGCEVPIPYVPN